ncbi:MAG: RNB domain-containing ribonuclease [Betaproteobacteria bacterium]|nr:RNB domain-containing ribonuclease [Betaproteobacteria bacterium]
MYLLYEEEGQFKAGTIVADNDTSLQIDTQFGKRIKLRAAQVMLRFTAPVPEAFMQAAGEVRAALDPDFLWEVAGQEEFDYTVLAQEYFGRTPQPAEQAGILQCLHDAPMYFYRKGRGRYRPAPPEALTAAKASLVRKQREAELVAEYVAELSAFRLPPAMRDEVDSLLYAPDKQQPAWRAVEAVCKQTGLTPLRLLDRCGAIASSHDYHLKLFLREYFPRGTGFAVDETLPALPDLPLATVRAFSIDDAQTTEIDDAFSVTRLADGDWQVGIHIAAPALGVLPGTALDQAAAARMSTVYHPAGKITMLPEAVIAAFSLDEGRDSPVLSMYLQVADGSWEVRSHTTRLECVRVVENLRHETLQAHFDPECLVNGCPQYPWQDELAMLWQLSGKLEAARGKTPDPSQPQRVDYQFRVDGERVTITDRQRGNPIDRVVSELMILVNAEWGRQLAQAGAMALYRTQQNGKVRMSSRPAPHVGLGVEQYAWASSPLRRYVDLLNQRQLIALVQDEPPPYPPKSDILYAALRDFETAYDAYSDFQRKMERYWCLRWLLQEQETLVHAVVIKENLLRLDNLPMVVRVPSLPETLPGTDVALRVDGVDLLEVELHCTWLPQE